MRPSQNEKVKRLRREARERGEVYRTTAEERRMRERRADLADRRRVRAEGGCPRCQSPHLIPDPATPGRVLCPCCPWFGRPVPQLRVMKDDVA